MGQGGGERAEERRGAGKEALNGILSVLEGNEMGMT